MCSSVQIHQTHCFQSMLIVRVLFMIEKQPFIFWLFIFNRTIMFKEGCIFKKIFSVVRCFSLINSKKKISYFYLFIFLGIFTSLIICGNSPISSRIVHLSWRSHWNVLHKTMIRLRSKIIFHLTEAVGDGKLADVSGDFLLFFNFISKWG